MCQSISLQRLKSGLFPDYWENEFGSLDMQWHLILLVSFQRESWVNTQVGTDQNDMFSSSMDW